METFQLGVVLAEIRIDEGEEWKCRRLIRDFVERGGHCYGQFVELDEAHESAWGGETGSCVGVEEMGYRQERCTRRKYLCGGQRTRRHGARCEKCVRGAGQGGLEDRDSC